MAAGAAGGEVDDRLDVQAHRALVQRGRHPLQHRDPPRGLLGTAGGEQARPVAAHPFRLVEREVGVGEHGLDVRRRAADDRRRPTLIVTRIRASARRRRGVADDVAQGLGQLHRDRGRGVRDDHGELVAAEPAEQHVGAQPGLDGVGDSRITRSPTAWPRRSLMSLKLSMSTSSSAAPPGRAAHSASHPVIRRRLAIAGERVVVGEERQLLPGAVGVGDVARGAEHPRRHARGVGEHLAEALEDPLGAPVAQHHAVGVGERLQRAQRRRQRLLDHPDVVRVQQRPVLRVVERGAAGDPEQVEQALRPQDAAVAHAPQPGAAAGHRLEPVRAATAR